MAESARAECPKTQPLLEICGLHAGYSGREVISGLSLCVRAGEVCALLGLNGSGKSTLLRAALGLLPVSGGEVRCAGRDVRAMSARERAGCMGYVPQRSRMDEGETALDAVLMGANARTPLLAGYSHAQRRQAQECLAQLGAAELAQRPVGTLSQGQRQLALFARAMMQRPQVFLLDEPDGALDLPRRAEMMARVRAMTAGGGCALAALHDASLALNACDRVLILSGGVIACELDMHAAGEDDVREAMRLLYGEVQVGRIGGRWAAAV